MEFDVGVHEQGVACRRSLVPTGRVLGVDDDVVRKEHGLRGDGDGGGLAREEAAGAVLRESHGIEHVGVSHPLEQRVRQGVGTSLIHGAGDHGLGEAVMVQWTVHLVEDVALAGVEIVVGAAGPEEPVHAGKAGTVGGPKELFVEIGQINVHGDAALAELGNAAHGLGSEFGRGESGQEQRCQNGDDGNDDEQFNEGEGARVTLFFGESVHVVD